MKTAILASVAVLSLAAQRVALASDLPPPPEGFVWKQIQEVKAAFLMPNGWHFKREEKKGTLAYFITAEDLEKVGRFDTGLTLNVKRHLQSTDTIKYAKKFVAEMGQANELIRSWETSAGPLHSYGCLTRNRG